MSYWNGLRAKPTKKLCFIGSSHMRALTNAWNQTLASQYPEYTARFFASPLIKLFQAEFLYNKISAPVGSDLERFVLRFSQSTSLEIDTYDAFIFQSLALPYHEFLPLSEQLYGKNGQEQQYISRSCLAAGLDLHFQTLPEKLYLDHISRYSSAPIVMSIAPKHSSLALERERVKYEAYLNYAELFDQLFWEGCQRYLAGYANLHFLRQPPETLENRYWTKLEYCSTYGQEPVEQITDYVHQNANYGKVVLDEIVKLLKSLQI
ncbi:MAG: hypothetical protein E6Q83_03875 [Thiothrix sp.]|nr:MAG: hypothetical protein E6Q83_03875 [Thiothrix sp.]